MSNFLKKDAINNNIGIDYKKKSNQIQLPNTCIGTKAEIFMKSNLNESEILEVKTDILRFYIQFLDQINSRFNFKREETRFV